MRKHQTTERGRHRSRAIAAIAVFVFAAACDSTTTEPIVQEVPIGGLFALTGSWSANGQVARAAMQLAIDDANEYLAGNAANLRFVARFEDTRLDPALALAKAKALRARGVHVLVGPMSSAEVAVVKPFVDASDMFLVSASSTAPSLAIAGDNVFRFVPADSMQAVAVAAMMQEDGKRVIVPVWRHDAAGEDLAQLVRSQFVGLGGSVLPGVRYEPGAADFTPVVAALRAQLQQAIGQYDANTVAVHLTAMGEVAALLTIANADPLVGTVHWYGSDGVAKNQGLLDAPQAAEFAVRTGYPNPQFGLEEGARDIWEPLAARIRQVTQSMEPDAYAMAAYDAVWTITRAYVAAGAGSTSDAARLKQAFITAASTGYGATGWTALNDAGDRKYGNYDFWAIRMSADVPRWTRVARYETRTRQLVR
ncbi:MAG TPA: ABC transporter substrate-binding protein [Gemmatimonadaceae bacterium]|nr:ABC transporter substrate-binding protein [Gemmatimonadaceae bacterium]